MAAAQSNQTPRPGQPAPPRDAPATRDPAGPTGSLAGHVFTADTGRPLGRARIVVSAPELPRGRNTTTTADGSFELTELPDGRYTVTASKTGFIGLSYGQRRPLQAGTPIEVSGGRQVKGLEFRLPRGSAIAGRVFDENGDPMPGIAVQVLRYDNSQGNRRLVSSGGAQTDDRGQYRVWGLNPGDYYVAATEPANSRGPFPGGGGPGGRGFGPNTGERSPTGYAPTYFPGVPSPAEARPVALALGAEASDVNFNVLLVPTSVVSGRVVSSDGSSTWAGTAALAPEGGPGDRGPAGLNYGGRIGYDGAFSIANVPPGRYTLRARSGMRGEPTEYASIPLTVSGSDLNVNVSLGKGATFAGSVRVESTQAAAPPDLTQFRITLPIVDDADAGPPANGRAGKDGAFAIESVPDGIHAVRGQAPRGFALKSVFIGGRDVVDAPFELRSGQDVKGVVVTFTDRLSQITGTLTDGHGKAVTDFTVLAFPTDPALWRAQSRQIETTRPDQNGKYQMRGLPPGDYYLAPVDPSEPGEWFDPGFLDQHRDGAARLTLGEGDARTQDFAVTPPR